MTPKTGYAFDLDHFESRVLALLNDLRVDESNSEDPAVRKVAYARSVQRHGFA